MTDSVPPVVVGIDGTPSGLEALALGSALAILTGAPLVLGAVYGHRGTPEYQWPPKSIAEEWLREAESELADFIPWSTQTVFSTSPARGLNGLAKREKARMLVIGSSHRGHVGRVLLGSTGSHVVHGAPCAVALAPRDWRTQPPDVPVTFGVGVIDSPESRDALALAGSLAAAADAPLKLVTVARTAPPADPLFAATGISYEQWRRDELAEAERIAREMVEQVRPAVEPEIMVLEGDSVERLAEASKDLDMLVVGSRRYGPLRSTLLGGVSTPLIERAACPVIIVPRGVHPTAVEAPSVEAAANA
ncbi:MAG TPA: universal stress protein [Solirubrobacter sp.]|nr:universal stress protein [Solirubrobacter sp.]